MWITCITAIKKEGKKTYGLFFEINSHMLLATFRNKSELIRANKVRGEEMQH